MKKKIIKLTEGDVHSMVKVAVNHVLNENNNSVTLYHGSPYLFDKFSNDKINTGQHSQDFGYGIYFTDNKSTAIRYAHELSKKETMLDKFNSCVTSIKPDDILSDYLQKGFSMSVKRIVKQYINQGKGNSEELNNFLSSLDSNNQIGYLYTVSINNPNFISLNEYAKLKTEYGVSEKELASILMEKGYNGIIYDINALHSTDRENNIVIFNADDITIINRQKLVFDRPLNINEAVGGLKTGFEQNIVNYIKSFGKKGKLPNYEGRLIDAYGPYMEEAYNWACKSTDGVQRDGFAFFKRHFSIDIAGRFNYNKRGLIYVERNIDIDTNQETNELEFKSIGECWSWKKNNASSYCSNHSILNNGVTTVTICGYVHPDSINWLETIYINSYEMANETEIRMNNNATVECGYILICGRKFPMGGTYLIDASADKYNPNRKNW